MPPRLGLADHRPAHIVIALALAAATALTVLALLSGEAGDDRSGVLGAPTTEDTTDPTVLGEVVESTTLPEAPPASAVGFDTTSTAGSSGSGPVVTAPPPPPPPPPTTPPPTLGPPTSVVRPTTTTTAPTTSTTPSTTETPGP
jgi:serine/threonine-protein kinase